jgi:hypothetical protein
MRFGRDQPGKEPVELSGILSRARAKSFSTTDFFKGERERLFPCLVAVDRYAASRSAFTGVA